MTVIAPEGWKPPPCSSCGRSDVAGVWKLTQAFEPLCPECYEPQAHTLSTTCICPICRHMWQRGAVMLGERFGCPECGAMIAVRGNGSTDTRAMTSDYELAAVTPMPAEAAVMRALDFDVRASRYESGDLSAAFDPDAQGWRALRDEVRFEVFFPIARVLWRVGEFIERVGNWFEDLATTRWP